MKMQWALEKRRQVHTFHNLTQSGERFLANLSRKTTSRDKAASFVNTTEDRSPDRQDVFPYLVARKFKWATLTCFLKARSVIFQQYFRLSRKKLIHSANNVSKISNFLDFPYFRFASGIHIDCELAIEARSPQFSMGWFFVYLSFAIYNLK